MKLLPWSQKFTGHTIFDTNSQVELIKSLMHIKFSPRFRIMESILHLYLSTIH